MTETEPHDPRVDRTSGEVLPPWNNEVLFARAERVLPGGVSSPVRAFRAVGGTPYFVRRASGAYVEDEEGRRYLDYVQSYGASLLGHAHPAVVAALHDAVERGTSYGAPTVGEILLAETIAALVPGCEMVRFTSSGTEATMTAVRLARGVTGRHRIVVFSGCYHGHSDGLLAAGGSGLATLGLPSSVGVPPSAVADTIVAPYNVVPELDETVAAVLVEPVAANMGVVAPAPGFLEGLRRACDSTGSLLVFDEVITGFRLGPGGASVRFGVRPDLWCFGKVIGGGLPIGAVGGRRDLLSALAPIGPVYQAGTLSGNPVATAAGLAVLGRVTPDLYRELERRVERLADGLLAAGQAAGVPVQVPRVGPLCSVFFSAEPVRDGAAAQRTDTAAYARFFHAMLRRGVALAPGSFEAVFTSAAHGEEEITRTIDVAGEAMAEVAAAA